MAEWKQGVRQDAPFQDQIRRVTRIRCFRCQAFNLLVDVYATANGPEKPCTASEIEHQLKVFEVLGHGAQHVGAKLSLAIQVFNSGISGRLDAFSLFGRTTFAACCSQKTPSKSHASLILLIRWQRRYLKFRNTI
jgi:hypothetical protein